MELYPTRINQISHKTDKNILFICNHKRYQVDMIIFTKKQNWKHQNSDFIIYYKATTMKMV